MLTGMHTTFLGSTVSTNWPHTENEKSYTFLNNSLEIGSEWLATFRVNQSLIRLWTLARTALYANFSYLQSAIVIFLRWTAANLNSCLQRAFLVLFFSIFATYPHFQLVIFMMGRFPQGKGNTSSAVKKYFIVPSKQYIVIT